MHQYDILEKGSPVNTANKAFIMIHGRGGSAENIISFADYFADKSFYLAAPKATKNSWYPNSFMESESSNEPWLSSAIELLDQLVQNIKEHIPSDRIYWLGFSQGACLTLEYTARNAERYGGIIGLTGGLIGKEIDAEKYKGTFKGTPIYISNGDTDPHVPLERTNTTESILKAMGANVKTQIFPGRPHTIVMEEIQSVRNFIFGSATDDGLQ